MGDRTVGPPELTQADLRQRAARSRTSKLERRGLGLAFCRLAIEAQRGTIHVEDGSPRGCVFVVQLPR